MKSFVKKLVSTSLCAAMLATSTLCAYAAEQKSDVSTGVGISDYQVLAQTDTIPANTFRMYVYGNAVSSVVRKGVNYTNASTGTENAVYFDSTRPYVDVRLSDSNKEYKVMNILAYAPNGVNVTEKCMVGASTVQLCNKAETYEKVKVKLSAFNSIFNNNGSCEKSGLNFTFGSADNSHYASLIIFSGSAVTVATPDANGYIEFYRSKKIGESTKFSTNFISLDPAKTFYGSGSSSELLRGMRIGDVDGNNNINIQDVTYLQKSIAGLEAELDSFAFERADVDYDGIINILDATRIQKYIAEQEG